LSTHTDTRPPVSTETVQPAPSLAAGSARPWWSAPFGMFQTNLREIDAGLDVERVLDYIQDHGADAWLVNAGGILSFYPTDLPFQTRNPYLDQRPSGDLLGDALGVAHARGIRLVARMDFSKVSARIAAEHPEWCYVSPSGQSQTYISLVSVCPSAQYYQEKTFEVLDEVIDRYAVDGFFQLVWVQRGRLQQDLHWPMPVPQLPARVQGLQRVRPLARQSCIPRVRSLAHICRGYRPAPY